MTTRARVFILLASVGIPGLLLSQCQIQSYSLSANCMQQAPLASVVLSGGTPPYQLVFTGANGAMHTEQSPANGSHSTLLPTWPVIMEPPVALQVTDAQGCVTNSSAFYIVHIAMWPEVWFEYACGGAAVDLYWIGTYNVGGASGAQSPCPANSYLVSGLSGFDQSGTLATGWTEVLPGIWRFNTPLALGTTYSVWIWPSGEPIGCSSGTAFYCHAAGIVSVPEGLTNCGVNFRMRAALAGALPTGTIMNDALRAANLIPLTEPYTALGFPYAGTPANLTIPAVALATTGNNAVVDWVVVELRAEGSPGTVVYSEPALLQRDGDVVDVLGASIWLNAPVPVAKYHVSIRHRNHLGVMTASPIFLHGNPAFMGIPLIDFRSSFLSVHGTEARMVVGTVQCLWPGDTNRDGQVKYIGNNNDRDPILVAIGGSTPTNVVSGVYSPLDVNMDGVIKYVGNGNDRDPILTTVGGSTPTNVRMQQLP